MDITSILEKVDSEMFGIWFLIGAALVFFMQCGFAMVETGFTRAKNAGNIIMKNLMDFCIGTPMFILLGFGLMMGEEVLGGFCGMPTLGVFTNYQNFDWSNFVFNLVFYTTPQLLGGTDTRVLATMIYQQAMSLGDWTQASVVAVVMIVVTMLVSSGITAISKKLNPTV